MPRSKEETRQKVLELKAKGLTPVEIANDLQVHKSYIYKLLKESPPSELQPTDLTVTEGSTEPKPPLTVPETGQVEKPEEITSKPDEILLKTEEITSKPEEEKEFEKPDTVKWQTIAKLPFRLCYLRRPDRERLNPDTNPAKGLADALGIDIADVLAKHEIELPDDELSLAINGLTIAFFLIDELRAPIPKAAA